MKFAKKRSLQIISNWFNFRREVKTFLFLSFRRVLNVIRFFLGNSLASKF